MKIISFLRKVSPLLFVGFLWSCDDEFNSVGSDIVGNDNMNITTYSTDNIAAYNRATGAVQTNGFPLSSLGIINNSVFGKSEISFVTQLQFPATTNPTQGISNPTITRVELTIPYFIKSRSSGSDGATNYVLDSLYGSADNRFKLNVYESGYFLRDFDPSTNFEERQKYYSDLYNEIYNARNPNRLNNSENSNQNDEFFFDKSEQIVYEQNEDGEQVIKERQTPQMKIQLDKAFFHTKIFGAPSGQMDNNNTFRNYFRGLFFQVEDLGQGSQMMQLNFGEGKITIYYTSPDNENEEEEKTVVLNLKGNSVNLVQNQFSSNYSNALITANEITGDEKLYIKGSEGSVAYINLFNGPDLDGDGVPDELQELRDLVSNENWLINEANLVFYIDKSQMDNLHPFVPQRIYLFNAEDNLPLADYYNDVTSISGYPKFAKWNHSGFISNIGSDNNRGNFYKVRITKHIKNLIMDPDTKNVKIGVSLTETITQIAMTALKDGVDLPQTSPYRYVPVSGVMSPLGTVLYGNNTTDTTKKLKLEILYTKP